MNWEQTLNKEAPWLRRDEEESKTNLNWERTYRIKL